MTGSMTSQITGVWVVYSCVCSGADQIKHQSSASLAFVRGIHRWPLNSPNKGPVTRNNVSTWWRHHDTAASCMPWWSTLRMNQEYKPGLVHFVVINNCYLRFKSLDTLEFYFSVINHDIDPQMADIRTCQVIITAGCRDIQIDVLLVADLRLINPI